jgi:hypothetical protein
MPGSSNTSFIPKRNPARNERQNVKRQVFLGSFIIRILFFASLVAAAGVFAYETKLSKNLDKEIVNLNTAIASFNEAEMERVLQMDLRLAQARERLTYSASIVSLLNAIEKSTTGSNQITQLSLERTSDAVFEVEAEMKTGTFDSVLFQREVLESSDTLAFSEIDNLTLQNVPPDNGLYTAETALLTGTEKVTVSFKAIMTVDTEKVPHTAAPVGQFVAPVEVAPVEEVVTTEAEVKTEEI